MFVILNCFIYSNYIFYLGVFSICSSSGPRALGICLFLLTLGLETCLMFWIYVFFVSLFTKLNTCEFQEVWIEGDFLQTDFHSFCGWQALSALPTQKPNLLFECFPNWVTWLNLSISLTNPETKLIVWMFPQLGYLVKFERYTWDQTYCYKDLVGRSRLIYYTNCQFSSVAQSCLTLCDPTDCSMPGFLVHHQLQELTQTHVHWAGDAIQPSHPLSSPSPPAFNLS